MNYLNSSLLLGELAVIPFTVSSLREKLTGSMVEIGYSMFRPLLDPRNETRHISKLIVAGQAVFTEVH